ncbi:hypothetical protein IEO21_01053 [Rhodonia placenta]|uniref:Glycopeptide n=1 Tax=Rhodonia placenta TaxID=104341 RepID=A0A8H7PA49_9APHY|nr:hypothetical protein IEO21_01053 [Postia placenta]
MLATFAVAVVTAAFAVKVNAETHTVSFTNECCTDRYCSQPYLLGENGEIVLSTGGESYTSDGPLVDLISDAFLMIRSHFIGSCGDSGEGCTVVNATLTNTGSSVSLELTPPYAFSVTTGFGFYNGCDGGFDCTSVECTEPYGVSPGPISVECSAPNVDLAITFCD